MGIEGNVRTPPHVTFGPVATQGVVLRPNLASNALRGAHRLCRPETVLA
jgi:hypothetical protein